MKVSFTPTRIMGVIHEKITIVRSCPDRRNGVQRQRVDRRDAVQRGVPRRRIVHPRLPRVHHDDGAVWAEFDAWLFGPEAEAFADDAEDGWRDWLAGLGR